MVGHRYTGSEITQMLKPGQNGQKLPPAISTKSFLAMNKLPAKLQKVFGAVEAMQEADTFGHSNQDVQVCPLWSAAPALSFFFTMLKGFSILKDGLHLILRERIRMYGSTAMIEYCRGREC